MTEQPGDYITKEEIEEGLELLHGIPVVELQAPADQIIETEAGDLEVAQSLGWVKFSAAFRLNMLRKLKGAKLAVFICICLHINERGQAFPGLETIAEETGYDRDTVMGIIPELEGILGLLDVFRRKGAKNIYRPAFAARGARSEPILPEEKVVGKNTTGGSPAPQTPTGLGQSSGKSPVDFHQKKRESLKEREREPALDFEKMTIPEAYKWPTLKMYRLATGFMPGSVIWESLDKAITENSLSEAQIREAAVAWVMAGHRLENVQGILDWAINGIPDARQKMNSETRPEYQKVKAPLEEYDSLRNR
jgi:hypothetical protein